MTMRGRSNGHQRGRQRRRRALGEAKGVAAWRWNRELARPARHALAGRATRRKATLLEQ